MFDKNLIDNLFNESSDIKRKKKNKSERLRLILPLIAVLLLGLLVVIPIIQKDVSTLAFEVTTPKKGEIEKLMVEELSFYVTDEKNTIHNFKAMSIEEVDSVNKITKLSVLDGIFNGEKGSWFNVKTDVGHFYQNKNQLKMPNIVDMFYSEGFEMSGTEIYADFNTSKIYSAAPVIGGGFLGQVNADGFEYDQKNDIMTFLGNVKIIKSEEQ